MRCSCPFLIKNFETFSMIRVNDKLSTRHFPMDCSKSCCRWSLSFSKFWQVLQEPRYLIEKKYHCQSSRKFSEITQIFDFKKTSEKAAFKFKHIKWLKNLTAFLDIKTNHCHNRQRIIIFIISFYKLATSQCAKYCNSEKNVTKSSNYYKVWQESNYKLCQLLQRRGNKLLQKVTVITKYDKQFITNYDSSIVITKWSKQVSKNCNSNHKMWQKVLTKYFKLGTATCSNYCDATHAI